MLLLAFTISILFPYLFWFLLNDQGRKSRNKPPLGHSFAKIVLIGLPCAFYTFVIIMKTPLPDKEATLLSGQVYTQNSLMHVFGLFFLALVCLKFIGNVANEEVVQITFGIILKFAAGSFMLGFLVSAIWVFFNVML